ncbi:hypothetical protein [Amycolatopsis magusensis]|uniref:Type VI protein secretion system component VasF n=1 Tax=Amycolatopsis magusensis TaxID=882444 RepID=A0ABS4PWQ1_9PSEU|nr:hypothetical protein [Amycolatopsis magusensis]MBP2183858.1 type VI protein secretion system component VasF [Amycolatopsis magusensis]
MAGLEKHSGNVRREHGAARTLPVWVVSVATVLVLVLAGVVLLSLWRWIAGLGLAEPDGRAHRKLP